MVTGDSYISNGKYMSRVKLWGKSTDSKPTNCGNGSVFTEMDTSKIYLFDAEGVEWLEWGGEST